MKIRPCSWGTDWGAAAHHTSLPVGGLCGSAGPPTPNEICANQHHATDPLANMSVPYTAKVARVNLVAAAKPPIALAPKPPIVISEPRAGGWRQGGGAGASGWRARRRAQLRARRQAPGGDGVPRR